MSGKISTGWPKKVINQRLKTKGKTAARLESAKFVDPRSLAEIKRIETARKVLGPAATVDDIRWMVEKLKQGKKLV